MARRRFFVPEVRNGTAELEGEDAKHLTQVLRVETGQMYEISDSENVYLAEVEIARKAQVLFRIKEQLASSEPMTGLTVLVSLIRFERLESILEKATELGVTEFRLVRAERSEKGLDLAVPKRMQRWKRIVLEASQQSRRSHLPAISGPVSLAEAVRQGADYRLFLDEERTGRTILDLVDRPGTAAILIGPEGGWPAHERTAALDAGWLPVTLGPLVLKTETAAIAALATLSAVFSRVRP